MTQLAFADRAGQMRERVSFQKRGPDINGDPLGAWAPQFSAAARVSGLLSAALGGLRRAEVLLQDRIAGVAPVVVTIRASTFTAALDNTWRLTWRGMAYDIRSVDPDERFAFLTILAEAVIPNDTLP